MLRSYARLLCFAFALLWGVQAPSFTDQYTQRVDAHRLEAHRSFAGFELIATQMFHGDVAALIEHHRRSTDAVFVKEADSIERIYRRVQMLDAEWQALQGSLWHRMLHVVFKSDRELLQETLDAYSYTVPLNSAAIACGLAAGLAVALLVELLLLGSARLIESRRHATPRGRAGRQ